MSSHDEAMRAATADTSFLPLQIADLLAHEAWRRVTV